jgi:polysaccharide deacetylase family protein (PEP-CTERM system associated)
VSIAHALSVDVEDWFQVLNMADHIERGRWDEFELRCVDASKRLLDLFDRRGAKATFFCLGWVAERAPKLIAEIASAGHEIGSHGYDHRLLHDLGRDGFRAELALTNGILAQACGQTPRAFRACTWSVTAKTPWAIDELVQAGFDVDSSIYPILHPDYGVRGAPSSPYRLRSGDKEILEIPPLCWDVLGRRIPVGGGGYLRLFPLLMLRRGLAQQEARGNPGCVYLHPWEVDPEQPRQALGGLRGFRHYVNLGTTMSKLDRLLGDFRFTTVSQALAQFGPSWSAKLPTFFAKELLG